MPVYRLIGPDTERRHREHVVRCKHSVRWEQVLRRPSLHRRRPGRAASSPSNCRPGGSGPIGKKLRQPGDEGRIQGERRDGDAEDRQPAAAAPPGCRRDCAVGLEVGDRLLGVAVSPDRLRDPFRGRGGVIDDTRREWVLGGLQFEEPSLRRRIPRDVGIRPIGASSVGAPTRPIPRTRSTPAGHPCPHCPPGRPSRLPHSCEAGRCPGCLRGASVVGFGHQTETIGFERGALSVPGSTPGLMGGRELSVYSKESGTSGDSQ